jgi:tetratricopeptide (TPR) repeat protein
MVDELRELWDFADLDKTQERFRALLERTADHGRRAEVLTQLARVRGLRGDFEGGHDLVDEAEALTDPDSTGGVRVLLERGRLLRSSGATDESRPLFISAFELAEHRGEENLAVDAAHMAALVDDVEKWTRNGAEIAQRSSDPQVRGWLGPLKNNLGGHYHEVGEYARALDAFEQALAAREEVLAEPAEIEIARYAVAKTLRALGRPGEAAELMERAVGASEPDGWFHEELAEDYAALGEAPKAAAQARRALELLPDPEPIQIERLRELARLG